VSRISAAVRALELTLRITAGDQLIARGKASVVVNGDD
jgi:hypothetical protein